MDVAQWLILCQLLVAEFEVSAETDTTQPSRICLGQACHKTDIQVWLGDGVDQFKRRSSLELEPWGKSIADGFILIHPVAEKEKKNGFDREEEGGEDEEMGLG